jgi:UDP-hydrolysing UDP-N-acetyl-D-glucosamine 2-epimerase
VVVCADRREVLAAAAAARMMEIETVHMQGGEKSGSVDDDVRDAITQLASVHCVATAQARHRVYGLTGDWTRIHQTGCPSIDLARQALSDVPVTLTELGGAGAPVALDQPFVVVLQHPTSDAVDEAGEQTIITLNALAGIDLPLVIFWPGQEPGAEAASKTIRMWQAQRPDLVIHTVRSLPPRRFLRLLTQAAVLVGNSSAGLREASYLGTPVVNIGTRQRCRERGQNVVTVPHKVLDISIAVRAQIAHGSYERSELYGDGTAGERIADILTSNRFDS